MKRLLYLIILFSASYNMSSQVGIGTTNPQADLHIGGDLLVTEKFNISDLNVVTQNDKNFRLLTRITNSVPVGEVKVMNVDSLAVAPINVVNYHISNLSKDNVTSLNLQYDATKYVVGIANFRYVGDALQKKPANNTNTIGTFVMRAFVNNGTWHLEIRNRDLDLDAGKSVNYHVTLIIYDKSYYRDLPPISTNLNGANTGTASSVPNIN